MPHSLVDILFVYYNVFLGTQGVLGSAKPQ